MGVSGHFMAWYIRKFLVDSTFARKGGANVFLLVPCLGEPFFDCQKSFLLASTYSKCNLASALPN